MGISGISIERLSGYSKSCDVLGNLKENDEIWIFGRRFVSVRGPSLPNEKTSPFLNTVDKIISFVHKLILAIGRLLTGQSHEKTLTKLEGLTDGLIEELGLELPPSAEDEYYSALEGFGQIRRSLQQASLKGLKEYKKRCEEGTHYIFPFAPEILEAHGKRVQGLIDKINAEVLPILSKNIESMHKAVLNADITKVKTIHEALYSEQGAASEDFSTMRISQEAFLSFAKSLFSEKHIQRVLEYYDLQHRFALSGTDVQALFIGMASNITYDDLYNYKGPIDLVKADLVDETTTFLKGLETIRNLDYTSLSNIDHLPYRDQLKHDQRLLHVMSDYADFDPQKEPDKTSVKSIRKYSYSEFLTRHLAYALFDQPKAKFPDGILFPMIDQHNKLCLKEAGKIVAGEGLYAAYVKPAVIHKTQAKVPLQVIFRGTYCKDSLLRDISPSETVMNAFFDGPGRVSFEKKREEIVNKILAEAELSVKDTNAKVTLEVMGHSLGASDAQRAVEYLTYKLREKKDHPFGRMRMFAFNSPNVESDIAKRFIASLESVKIPFVLRYLDVHHDSIQEFGTKRLGYCGSKHAKPDNLKVSIFKFDRKVEEAIEALTKNIISKAKFFFDKSLEAHTDYSLKLHEHKKPGEYNATFIRHIYTNNDKDTGLIYGKEMHRTSKKIATQDAMDYHLLTNTGRIGRKMKLFGYDLLHVLSFGQWSHSYQPGHFGLKQDREEALLPTI